MSGSELTPHWMPSRSRCFEPQHPFYTRGKGIGRDDGIRQRLEANPSRFLVAAGFALRHGEAKNAIDSRLIAFALRFEPRENVGIYAHRHWPFYGPIELADLSGAPVGDLGEVRRINIGVFHS